jgi:hypothetical protein
MAKNLEYTKQEILSIAADGPSFKYKEKFGERKLNFPTYDKTLVDPLEQELDQLTFEELPRIYEKVNLIKEEERLYKNKLDEERLREREMAKGGKKSITDDADLLAEKKRKKNSIINSNKINDDEDDFYTNGYYSDDEEDYETDNENLSKNYNKSSEEENDDVENEIEDEEDDEIDASVYEEYPELDIENFQLEEDDFLTEDELIDELKKELENIKNENQNNDTNMDEEQNNTDVNIYFSEFGSKYKHLIITDEYNNIDILEKELYDFFSIHIKNDQIIEVFELIF